MLVLQKLLYSYSQSGYWTTALEFNGDIDQAKNYLDYEDPDAEILNDINNVIPAAGNFEVRTTFKKPYPESSKNSQTK